MYTTAPRHRTFPAFHRDYIHRRRLRRRLTNVILIPLLSGVAAYFITRPTGGKGFTAPKSAQQESLSTASNSPTNSAVGATASSALPAAAFVANPVASPAVTGAYKLADGPHAVTEVPDIVLHDAKRNKDLHLRIFYPTDRGPYPVIVFSHGAGGSQSCCDALTRHWATDGYITLQPTHDDSTLQRRNSGEEDIHFLKAVRDALKKPALWQSRPQDISFVLDSLPALQKRIPALSGKIDAQRIGVGGHSMGAFTADAIAGALVDLPNHPATNFADPRVKAVLLLSPQGPGEFGLDDHSWDQVSIPLLSMTGSLDRGAGEQDPEWRKIPFERSQPGDKYHVFIQGANHMSFVSAKTLLPARAARNESILGYTNSASLAFWDAYLKADPAARSYLQSDALSNSTHGAVKLSRR
jgi:predicted dienelactone hydrolase